MEGVNGDLALDEMTVLIPARNEAEVIQRTLESVIEQGPGVRIVLIDDHSEDGYAEVRRMRISNLRIVWSFAAPDRLERQALGPRQGPLGDDDSLYVTP